MEDATEGLKNLLRQWLANCGVFLSDVDRRDGAETWRCVYCEAKSTDGRDWLVHEDGCLVRLTEKALLGEEHHDPTQGGAYEVSSS